MILFTHNNGPKLALDRAEELFQGMSRGGIIKREPPHVGYMLIADGTQPFDPDGLDGVILGERKFFPDLWPEGKIYDQIARAKTLVAWREKMSTLDIVRMEPWRLREGDCRYPGAVWHKGILVSFSGVEAINDHLLSSAIVNFIIGFTTAKADEILPTVEGPYL